MDINVKEADFALTEKPLLATSVERVMILNELKTEFSELPQPLRCSRFLSVLLERVSTPLEEYDLIAGRCVDRELDEREEAIFQSFIRSPDYPNATTLFGATHCTLSWGELVSEGLVGLRRKAEVRLDGERDEDKRVFLRAAIEIYDALAAYLLRYARAAEEKGMRELARTLTEAACERPSSFRTALQLLWTVTLVDCAYIVENPTLTLGRLDVILYPLYASDIASGRMTEAEARAYITDYYCKHNLIMGRGEHQLGDETNSTTFKRILNFDAPQYLLLGGRTEGGDAVNRLTELFVECIVPSFKNPVVVYRYVKDTDKDHPELWQTLTERALAGSSLMFYNDNVITDSLMNIGLPPEEAREYSHFGCNWCSTGDNGAWMLGGPYSSTFGTIADEEERKRVCIPFMRSNRDNSWPEDLIEILHELDAEGCEELDLEEVYRRFFARMEGFLERKLAHLSEELSIRRRRPSAVLTFADCFTVDSISNAECYSAGAKYHFEQQSFLFFATVADCFTVLDELVVRRGATTLHELLLAVDANFDGYGDLLTLCKGVKKFGSDTQPSNLHAKRLIRTACRLTVEKSRPYFEREGLFLMPAVQCDTWHIKMGARFGATPDGRLAGEAFSQNSNPTRGASVSGCTATLNSMLALPTDAVVSGAFNLDVDPKQFAGERRPLFSVMLASYLNRGGLHAQVSCNDVEVLRRAQADPQTYKDLRVRVTGYTGIFVDMPKRLQDDVIKRFE